MAAFILSILMFIASLFAAAPAETATTKPAVRQMAMEAPAAPARPMQACDPAEQARAANPAAHRIVIIRAEAVAACDSSQPFPPPHPRILIPTIKPDASGPTVTGRNDGARKSDETCRLDEARKAIVASHGPRGTSHLRRLQREAPALPMSIRQS